MEPERKQGSDGATFTTGFNWGWETCSTHKTWLEKKKDGIFLKFQKVTSITAHWQIQFAGTEGNGTVKEEGKEHRLPSRWRQSSEKQFVQANCFINKRYLPSTWPLTVNNVMMSVRELLTSHWREAVSRSVEQGSPADTRWPRRDHDWPTGLF